MGAPELGKIALVGTGGFIGSVLRYVVSSLVQIAIPTSKFPYGTLTVNVTGCFAIGLVSQIAEAQGAFGLGARTFLVVGLLGGYTTFSAFGNETMNLLRDGDRLAAGMTICGHILLGFCAVWFGRLMAQLIWK